MQVVVDHKSAPIAREHCERKATQYTGQLLAYREALEANQEVIQSTIIHFPLAGVIATVILSRQTNGRVAECWLRL